MTKFAISESDITDDLLKLHVIHKRNTAPTNNCYEQLSLSQKISASHLRQFGFELMFVHGELTESMAIFSCAPLNVTVDYYGEINSMAALYFRK